MARIDDLSVWRTFCEVVRTGSVTAACASLGCEASTVSRALKAIEADIGAPVFRREGRGLRLTELGMRADAQARALLDMHERMVEGLKGDEEAMAGTVRLAAHAGIASSSITPCLIEFRRIYPEVALELRDLTAGVPEIFHPAEGLPVHIAVSYGPDLPIEGVVARHLGEMPFICCASPLYLEQAGAPRRPEDFAAHTGILIKSPTRVSTEELHHGDVTAPLRWRSSMTFKNLAAVRTAAVLGAGIVPDLPLFHAVEALRAGELRVVLEGWRCRPASCFVYATEEAWTKRRVRALVEAIAAHERKTLAGLRREFPEFY